ncbi:hypothetical protein PYV61_23440, partial [Roseisolibacter sp. H3M3-2]
ATPAAAASPASPAASAPAAPAANAGPAKLDITGERVGLFLAAMAPALDAARERGAYLAAKRRHEAYSACVTETQVKTAQAAARGESVPAPTRAQQAELDRVNDRNAKLVDELSVAQQRNDTARVRLLAEESQHNLLRVMVLSSPAVAKACGATPPQQPSEPDAARLREAARPRKVDGMSATQFGRMRERIALYLVAGDKPNDLTPEEKRAIDARRAELAPFAQAWKDGSLEWSGWSDVFTAWK